MQRPTRLPDGCLGRSCRLRLLLELLELLEQLQKL
jgi:hypothetical protein